MSKGKIITLSIIGAIIAICCVLFGAVFRLRKQMVIFVGEGVEYSSEEIVSTAGLKNGKSIFLLDKDKAIANLEEKYADLKVVQIKTVSVARIEIVVRKRYETYYTKYLGNYYVLDQDLKVLNIIPENDDDQIALAENLVHITSKLENLTQTTKITDFVGNSAQLNMAYNLFSAVYSTQMPDKETGSEAHQKFCELITAISFDVGYTPAGTVYNRLIIASSQGTTFDIGQATDNLERKINICFTAILKEEISSNPNGKIIISYGENNKETINYYNGEVDS